NNMLLSPLLHFVHTGSFLLMGAGSVQARLVSVLFSLFTLLVLFAALRRAFDIRIAATATLFLGLDHTYLLFNRMALMDTPATLPAVAAFYAFGRATLNPKSKIQNPKYQWFVACGALMAITYISRSLCAYLIPAPFLALWLESRRHKNEASQSP